MEQATFFEQQPPSMLADIPALMEAPLARDGAADPKGEGRI
ncbi:MAG: hypothetical protein P4M05_00980 [Bradyrhizobium sp.]|jgi:hypothetical protein|nr:hypothetical protein [Bradyrhizobium sp.]